MWMVMKTRVLAVAVGVCLLAVAACSSDDDLDGSGSFRNLGKRGDSNVTTGHARAVVK